MQREVGDLFVPQGWGSKDHFGVGSSLGTSLRKLLDKLPSLFEILCPKISAKKAAIFLHSMAC